MATAGACGKASTSQKVFVVHMFSDMTLAVNAWGEWRSFILCDNHVWLHMFDCSLVVTIRHNPNSCWQEKPKHSEVVLNEGRFIEVPT